jgi:hypothetical protein
LTAYQRPDVIDLLDRVRDPVPRTSEYGSGRTARRDP